MKQWLIVMVAGLLLTACGDGHEKPSQSGEAVEAGEVAPVARTIDGSFGAAIEHISLGDVSGGIGLLLDIPLMTGPEQSLPTGFKRHIELARTAYATNNRTGFAAELRAALRAWNPGWLPQDRKPHSSGKNPPPAPPARIFLDRVENARELMKNGEAEPAVTVLLEALLLVQPAAAD